MISLKTTYPASYDALEPGIRQIALKIAGCLQQNGFAKDISYLFAYANARLKASNGQTLRKDKSLHLVPHASGWAVVTPDGEQIYFIEPNKCEALMRARGLAKSRKVKLFIHSPEGFRDCESFEVNRMKGKYLSS